jgi:GT2 family glycosyltransferase
MHDRVQGCAQGTGRGYAGWVSDSWFSPTRPPDRANDGGPEPTTPHATTTHATTVVISWNRRDDLMRTLPLHDPPVILVDNGSTDGTVEAVRRAHPDIDVVALDRNRGAAARNLGVERAQTAYVAFADDDSWWARGAVRRAVEILQTDPAIAVVNGKILLGTDNRVDPVSDVMARSPLASVQGRWPSLLGFVACASVVRRSAFLAAGGFDDVVFFPGEEERVALDLAALGAAVVYADDVIVHHHPSTSRESDLRRRRVIARNRILTATMRRPWRVVAREIAESARSEPGMWRAVADAVPRMPRAVAARRRLPAEVEDRLAALAATPSSTQ